MEIVELIGKRQEKVFVAPSRIAAGLNNGVHLFLELTLVRVGTIDWQVSHDLRYHQKFISLLSRDSDGFMQDDFLRVLHAAAHPRRLMLAIEDTELVRAAACDAAQHTAWKLLVLLKLQPVYESAIVTTRVHRQEEILPVQHFEFLRAEARAESLISGIKLRIGKHSVSLLPDGDTMLVNLW